MDISAKQSAAKSSSVSRSGPGWLYEMKSIDGLTDAYGMATVGKPYVNREEMSAWATISTATPDRVGDVLVPRGIVLDQFSKNPSCYWSHGLDTGMTLPIGIAKHPDGSIAIDVSDEKVVGKTYFAQRNPIAVQIFHLIDDGVIVATSVRETPISSHKGFMNGERVEIVDKWRLEEFSWTGLGVNPDAVAKAVSRNRIDGRPLHASIMKSLTAALPEKPATSIGGFVEKPMSTLKTDPNEMSSDGNPVNSNIKSDSPPDKDEEKKPADEVADDKKEPAAEVEPGGDAPGDPDEDQKLGRQSIQYAHDSIKSLRGNLRSAMKCMEHPEVKDGLQGVHDELGKSKDALEGMREDHYPTSSQLKSEDESDDGGDAGGDDSDSDMKSLLKSHSAKKYQIQAVKADLKSLSKSKSLTVKEKKLVDENIARIDRLIEESKVHAPAKIKSLPAEQSKPTPAIDEAESTKMKALEERLANVTSKLTGS